MAMTYAQVRPTEPGSSNQPALLPAAVVFATSPFGGLARETARRVETPIHEKGNIYGKGKIVKVWEQYLRTGNQEEEILLEILGKSEFINVYRRALDSIRGISCSASDLEAFAIILEEFQHEKHFEYKAGAFISALINTGSDRRYVVKTNHLAVKIHGLGAYNERDVIIDGDAGEFAGMEMVNGNLTITGSVSDWAGYKMQSGILAIEGNGREDGMLHMVGIEMTGGEIHINNIWCNRIIGGNRHGGKIFLHGVQVYPPLEVV